MRVLTAAALLAIAGCGAAPSQDVMSVPTVPTAAPTVPAFRLTPPAPIATPEFSAPRVRAFDLPNGVRVRSLHREGPLCSLRMRLVTEVIDKAATLAIMAPELKAGTKAHPGGGFTQAMNALGVQLDVFGSSESVDLLSTFPPEAMEAMLGLMAEALLTPTFPRPSFDAQRAYKASYSDATWKLPANLAEPALERALFGADHIYGHLTPDASQLRAVVYEDMVATHAAVLDPSRIIVAAGGTCNEVALRPAVEKAFGAMVRAPTRPAPVVAPAVPTRRLVVVDSPGALEVEIVLGVLGPTCMSTDWYTELVVNQVMRQRATDRIQHALGLTDNLWVTGLGYSAAGGTVIRASVRREKLPSLLAEVESLLAYASHADESAVADARSRILLQDAGAFERARDITAGLAGLAQYGPDGEGFVRFRTEVHDTTVARVAAYGKTYLAQSKPVAVVVGDVGAMRADLPSLGWEHVEQRDASGALVTTFR